VEKKDNIEYYFHRRT